MSDVIGAILQINKDIARRFEFDYILFDALFLGIWVALLVWQKRSGPLRVGIVCAVIVYVIDGVIWTAVGIREYGIPAPWVKLPVDFMMDVSYGMIAFSWVWIAFERKSAQDVVLWTALLFAGWLIIPFASRWISLVDAPINTVRHMSSRVWLHISVVLIGYAALLALGYDAKAIAYVFWVGCMLAFMMEFSLLVSGIRSPSLGLLAYETLILTNQGIPYLYVIKERILPVMTKRAAQRAAVRSASRDKGCDPDALI
jgi:hypothetical protein